LRDWLLAMGAASLVTFGALLYTWVRVRGGEPDQRALFKAISGHHVLTTSTAAVGALPFLTAGLVNNLLGLTHQRPLVLSAATVVVIFYLSRAVVAWQRIQR
jgi:hypothetical protein